MADVPIPEPWASAMIAARLTDSRYAHDVPSLGRLAEESGVHTTTVSDLVYGRKKPKHATVVAVAQALGVDVVEVSRWSDHVRSVREPYRPPVEVNQLTDREQDALTLLIKAMAAARKEAVGNAQHPAPIAGDRAVTGVPGPGGPPAPEPGDRGGSAKPRSRSRTSRPAHGPDPAGEQRSAGTNHGSTSP